MFDSLLQTIIMYVTVVLSIVSVIVVTVLLVVLTISSRNDLILIRLIVILSSNGTVISDHLQELHPPVRGGVP